MFRGEHVDQVGGVHVDVDVALAQLLRVTALGGLLPRLRRGQEDLHAVGVELRGRRERSRCAGRGRREVGAASRQRTWRVHGALNAAATLPSGMARRVLILGSTGSIGEQALDVLARSDELGQSGSRPLASAERLVAQARAANVRAVALSDPQAAAAAAGELPGLRVLAGEEGIRELIAVTEPDMVLNAIVGTAGLGPTIVALTAACIDLALANKESLVVEGELVTALAEATQARILPVDSEHSALFQLLRGEGRNRTTPDPDRFRRAVARAHRPRGRHPRGGARPSDLGHGRADHDRLGDADEQGAGGDRGPSPVRPSYERIDVVVHPQSIVHSLVELNDGAQLAHLGLPDMRVPISYALHFPERADVAVPTLDLAAVGELTFEPPDLDTFPCLRLARAAGAEGARRHACSTPPMRSPSPRSSTGRLPFAGIGEVIEALEAIEPQPLGHFEQLFDCDAAARHTAARLVERPRRNSGGRSRTAPLLSACHELAARVRRLRGADHPPRGRAHGRREGGGMRVERFFLFFPPKIWSVRRGETEYGIGAIPLGGFVKITGMNPDEELPPDVAPAATTTSRCEADRGHRGEPGGQPG